MVGENADAFLARLSRRGGRFNKADRSRLDLMMAEEAERRGDVEAAAKLRARASVETAGR